MKYSLSMAANVTVVFAAIAALGFLLYALTAPVRKHYEDRRKPKLDACFAVYQGDLCMCAKPL